MLLMFSSAAVFCIFQDLDLPILEEVDVLPEQNILAILVWKVQICSFASCECSQQNCNDALLIFHMYFIEAILHLTVSKYVGTQQDQRNSRN